MTRTAPSSDADSSRAAGNDALRYVARQVTCFWW